MVRLSQAKPDGTEMADAFFSSAQNGAARN
jgi:hypothetical protein